MRRPHFIKSPTRRNGRRGFGWHLTARLSFFAPGQFFGQHFSKLFRRNATSMLAINDVRRETSQLIPGHHVRRRLRGSFLRVKLSECAAGNVGKTQAMTVAEEPRSRRQMMANRREGLVTAGR